MTTYEDYQTIDGFPIARKETTQRDGKLASTTELIEFKVGTPSQGAFDKPCDRSRNRKGGDVQPSPLFLDAPGSSAQSRSCDCTVGGCSQWVEIGVSSFFLTRGRNWCQFIFLDASPHISVTWGSWDVFLAPRRYRPQRLCDEPLGQSCLRLRRRWRS